MGISQPAFRNSDWPLHKALAVGSNSLTMIKTCIYLALFILLPVVLKCQATKIDTLKWDNKNKHFTEFAGTWYDNLWENPVMRGFSLSRTKKDSSRFSLTFNIDGSVTSQSFKDSNSILDSTSWWYDGTFIYFKQINDLRYTAKKVIKYKDGSIIIAYRPSGQFILLRPLTRLSRKDEELLPTLGFVQWPSE